MVKTITVAGLLSLLLSGIVSAAEQRVSPTPLERLAGAEQEVAVSVGYTTTAPCNGSLMGIGLRIHWDSSRLTFLGLAEVLQTALVGVGSVADDWEDADFDRTTDKSLLVTWGDIAGNWPGGVCPDIPLYQARFRTNGDFAAGTAIRFSASSAAAGYQFSSAPALVRPDTDGDGIPDDLIDADRDGVGDDADRCPGMDDRTDLDRDGTSDCLDVLVDSDQDGISNDLDNCPVKANADQANGDGDGPGDACDANPGAPDGVVYPKAFSAAWLKGRTLYMVWFGSSEDAQGNEIDDVPVVVELKFLATGGKVAAKGLLNNYLATTLDWAVDETGLLYFDGDPTGGNRVACEHTEQFMRSHYLDEGRFDDVNLLFQNRAQAIAYAKTMTEWAEPCVAGPGFARLPSAWITADGHNGDWSGVAPVLTDAAGDQAGSKATDIKALYAVAKGSRAALLLQVAGNITLPHTPAAAQSHYDVAMHYFSGLYCWDDPGAHLGFQMANHITPATGATEHVLRTYRPDNVQVATDETWAAHQGSLLETVHDRGSMPQGAQSVWFSVYVRTNDGAWNPTPKDEAVSSCYLLPEAIPTRVVDSDRDGIADDADPDDDNDGLADAVDPYPLDSGRGAADGDGDGVQDKSDNCPAVANTGQADHDSDRIGDACDPDDDNDGVLDTSDNCPWVANADKANHDSDASGDACDSDDDNDGVLDAADSAPLDATNQGPVIALPLNSVQTVQHGWGWGNKAYKTILAATFTGNGTDRLLHVQGYDVDSADELAVWLNGNRLGYLTPTATNALGMRALWWLPAASQVAGLNRIEIRQKTAGETWGVTRLGLYAPGVAFGNLKTLAGGDITHGTGFELHLPQSTAGYLLGLSGYDSDTGGTTSDEISLTLNGKALLDLPKGADAAWTTKYQLVLPGAWLRTGDNLLLIKNRGLATEDWGVRLDGLRGFGANLGQLTSIPAAQRLSDKVSFLLAPRAIASVLGYQCYDADTATEIRRALGGVTAGSCPATDNQAWGARQRQALSANQRHLFVLDNTLNPPGTDTWLVRLVAWLEDNDADGAPDTSDNCIGTANPDQANLDGDKEGDACDGDVDGDGHANAADAFPRNRVEWLDTDGDGVGNNADHDDDNDGVLDAADSAPLDAANKGPVITLPLNSVETAEHGWGWGDKAYGTVLGATFTGDATDRLLHVQGYDVDSADELAIWLNGKRLGYLTPTATDALGMHALWWLPTSAQVAGINRVEIRQKTAGETWGVTQLGVYATGAAVGNLKALAGGDTTRGSGFELHLPQATAGYLLGVSGYDSDADNEIRLTLNGKPLVDLPKGADAAWTPMYQLVLPEAWLGTGDNVLLIKNRGLVTEDWGVRLDGLRAFGAGLGQLASIPAAERLSDKVNFLLAPGATASVLDYQCYDADTATEIRRTLNGAAAGSCPATGNNAWGSNQRRVLSANARHLFVLDNILNPPGTDTWAVRLLDWLVDTDADTIPDSTDYCPSVADKDQADLDGDKQGDVCDADIDGDGHANGEDAFPRDKAEWLDSDGDTIGDNADHDDDNDGFPDAMDPFPLDAAKVPPASIGVHRPSTRRFILDADGDLATSAGDTNAGPFGTTTDIALTGDWNGDGRDEIGFYRPGTRRFYLDFDGDGLWNATVDRLSLAFGAAGDLPVIGDWDGDGIDDIGIYSPTARTFILDLDGSLSPTAGDLSTAAFQTFSGLPLAGDWNGDGRDDIGVWRPSTWRFYLDSNASRTWNTGDRSPVFGQAGDLPLVGDWNGDGKDEIGVYRPSSGRFYLDSDGSFTPTATDETSGVFGVSTDKPLSGRW